MKLEEYLEAEGVPSNLESDEVDKLIKDKLGYEKNEELDGIKERLFTPDAPNALKDMTEFLVKHDINSLANGHEWPEMCAEIPETLKHLPDVELDVLDVGCGSGLKTVFYVINRPKLKITALDRSASVLEMARKRASKYDVPVKFECADFFEFKPVKQYDLLLASTVFHEQFGFGYGAWGPYGPVYMWDECIEKSKDLLKTDGRLLFSLNIAEGRDEFMIKELNGIADQLGFKRELGKELLRKPYGSLYLFVWQKA